MKFSLLYKNIPEYSYEDQNPPFDIIYDLSIDKSVSRICRDTRKADYFLSVMRRMLTDVDDIVYRQNLLADFIEYPELLDELKVIFSRYDKIKSDWVELRSTSFPSASSSNSSALLEHTFSSLKLTSIFPRTIISFYENIGSTIAKYDVKSHALVSMMSYCNEMTENNSLNEIADIASLFQYKTAEDYDFGVLCRLDSTMRLVECELCDIREHQKDKKPLIDWKALASKKNKDAALREVDADKEAIDGVRFVLTEALYHIDSTLNYITNIVYETFHGLSSELMFYEVALKICEYLSENDVPLCVPDLLDMEHDTVKASSLRDFYLAAGGKKGSEIIPNDVSFEKGEGGVLIRGRNNTGKTTFLRSLGTAQLFAQAGLPVCAESASFSVRSAVFTHFSSAEEDFIEGDTSGRFEGEVKEMAKMVDNLKPYSLILLNETFQTTSYDEGACGIYNILSLFTKMKAKFVFVTHLLGLFDMCGDIPVRLMETVLNDSDGKRPYVISDINK